MALTLGAVGTKDPCGSCPRYYSALNRAVSGGAADINKKKTLAVYRERKRIGFTMRMTIHDEMTGDLEKDPRSKQMLQEVLDRQDVPLKVPILWDVATGKNWAECK